MTQTEVLRLALEALEKIAYVTAMDYEYQRWAREAITAIKAALEAKDEPVALETVYETIIHWDEGGGKRSRRELARRIVDLYTTPPQRTWVGMTDEEWVNALGKVREQLNGDVFGGFYRVIEAKLKEKNYD